MTLDRVVRMSEAAHGVLCAGKWGSLLVPWSRIATVVYAGDDETLIAEPESPPVRENASWQATGVAKNERVDDAPIVSASGKPTPSAKRKR